MGTFYTYLSSFLQHWWAVFAAGMFLGVDEALQKWAPEMMARFNEKMRPYRRPLQVLFLIGAVFYAGYAAWHDEHKLRTQAEEKLVRAEAERDEVRRQLAQPRIFGELDRVSEVLPSASSEIDSYMKRLSKEQAKTIYTLGAKEADAIGRLVVGYHNTGQTINYILSITEALERAGINITERGMRPDNPNQTGVMLSCEDPENITDAGSRIERVFAAAKIEIKRIGLLKEAKQMNVTGCMLFIGPHPDN